MTTPAIAHPRIATLPDRRPRYGYDRPVLFYALASAIPWALWCVAAALSHLPQQTPAVATTALLVLGLISPVAVVAWLVRDRPDLRADICQRLLWPRRAPKRYLIAAVALMPVSLLLAQAVSLLFGYSAGQFLPRDGFSFTAGVLPVWSVLLVAAILEELAWHSYGTDALLSRLRLLPASLLFTVIWALWHLPLSFVKGYYHAELIDLGWLHSLNFPISMVAFVVLMNWLYFRSGRSIMVAVIVHTTANFANEVFATHPDTKLILTALLLVLTVVVVIRERQLFLGDPRALALPDQMAQ